MLPAMGIRVNAQRVALKAKTNARTTHRHEPSDRRVPNRGMGTERSATLMHEVSGGDARC